MKTKLLECWDIENSESPEPPEIFKPIEKRLLDVMEQHNLNENLESAEILYETLIISCRICLKNEEKMLNLFDTEETMEIVSKINTSTYISPVNS